MLLAEKMAYRLLLLFFSMFALLPLCARGNVVDECPVISIVPERLPDMTMARSGHRIFYVNGELTVTGGHIKNFVLTQTAEYFDGTSWHVMDMAYPHDNGFAVVLQSGEVLIGGGHQDELGVGQTYTLEQYHPQTHTFEGFGCLDCRRVLANAMQLADGRVIISGNHYAPDAIGCYDGKPQVEHVASLRQYRSNPYILPISADDAVILGGNDNYDRHPDTVWVDRLKGEAFRVPLLEQWRLVYTDQPFSSEACSMADYTYLLTATDASGQLGFVVMSDTTFSLLSTVCPVPVRSRFGPILYKGPVAFDKARQRGYVIGVDSLCHHQYILAIDCRQKPAALTLYHTDSQEEATITIPVLTPDGDLILVGGIASNNYKPLASVWLYHFATTLPTAADSGMSLWLMVGIAVAVAVFLASLIVYLRRRKQTTADDVTVVDDVTAEDPIDGKTIELMEHIRTLMEEEHLYLRTDLKLQDVAVCLHTNSSYVSECINSVCGQTFSQFVNEFRVRHAMELLRQQPDMKIVAITSASGFSTEASFFRNFKTVTGMTPREWVASL